MRKSVIIYGVVALAVSNQLTFCQMMPSHGASAAGRAPAVITPTTMGGPSWAYDNDLGVDFLLMPSPRDRHFDQMLGINLNITFPVNPNFGFRLGTGYESFDGKNNGGDADVVPFGFSFLIGPPAENPLSYGAEFGLRYNVVDYHDYDDGVGAILGVGIGIGQGSGFGVALGLNYRFDISDIKNRQDEKISLEGFALLLSLRGSF